MGETWRAVAALVDRSRRALYLYVRRQDHPVSREEAAGAQQITRNLAAFHLDKLVEAGLLQARYEVPAGPRRRGRAPKVYEPTGDLSITVPERRYQLLADILAEAVAGDPTDAAAAARAHARSYGQRMGEQLRAAGTGAGLPAHRQPELVGVLEELGFDPTAGDGATTLANCPFRALADRHTELVCGLNYEFVSGLLTGLGVTGLRARLVPQPPRCCVELSSA